MGRNWQRRESKVEKRRKWRESNKAVSYKEPKRITKQRRHKSKEDLIWETHEGEVYEV